VTQATHLRGTEIAGPNRPRPLGAWPGAGQRSAAGGRDTRQGQAQPSLLPRLAIRL